jgi:hypothetical protein
VIDIEVLVHDPMRRPMRLQGISEWCPVKSAGNRFAASPITSRLRTTESSVFILTTCCARSLDISPDSLNPIDHVLDQSVDWPTRHRAIHSMSAQWRGLIARRETTSVRMPIKA